MSQDRREPEIAIRDGPHRPQASERRGAAGAHSQRSQGVRRLLRPLRGWPARVLPPPHPTCGRGRQRGSRGVRGGARVHGHVRPPARPCKAWPVGIARHELADTSQRRRVEDRARRRLGLEPWRSQMTRPRRSSSWPASRRKPRRCWRTCATISGGGRGTRAPGARVPAARGRAGLLGKRCAPAGETNAPTGQPLHSRRHGQPGARATSLASRGNRASCARSLSSSGGHKRVSALATLRAPAGPGVGRPLDEESSHDDAGLSRRPGCPTAVLR